MHSKTKEVNEKQMAVFCPRRVIKQPELRPGLKGIKKISV